MYSTCLQDGVGRSAVLGQLSAQLPELPVPAQQSLLRHTVDAILLTTRRRRRPACGRRSPSTRPVGLQYTHKRRTQRGTWWNSAESCGRSSILSSRPSTISKASGCHFLDIWKARYGEIGSDSFTRRTNISQYQYYTLQTTARTVNVQFRLPIEAVSHGPESKAQRVWFVLLGSAIATLRSLYRR